jgi:hypothetical protein
VQFLLGEKHEMEGAGSHGASALVQPMAQSEPVRQVRIFFFGNKSVNGGR